MRWDDLNPDERRSVALQCDYKNDPTAEKDREYWWDARDHEESLENAIAHWSEIATPTAKDLALKEARLEELKLERAFLEKQKLQRFEEYYPAPKQSMPRSSRGTAKKSAQQFISFPHTIELFSNRFNATPEELASWVLLGPKEGGIAAYTKDFDTPVRFYFRYSSGQKDYLASLRTCWFLKDDIDSFQPLERFITGKALIERWSNQLHIDPEMFIIEKLQESRLSGTHPTLGSVSGNLGKDSIVPLDNVLFSMAEASAIEAEEIGTIGAHFVNPNDYGKPCVVLLSMRNLTADELKLIFVGDISESGFAANNMLEISARGKSLRVALAAIDLVNKQTGALNSQGVILVGMAKNRTMSMSMANSTKIKRLRNVFRNHVGIKSDPFEPYRQGVGWMPRFSIADKRGASDKRATLEAERRTDSYEQVKDRADRFADKGEKESSIECINDAASEWLKMNDPDYKE